MYMISYQKNVKSTLEISQHRISSMITNLWSYTKRFYKTIFKYDKIFFFINSRKR